MTLGPWPQRHPLIAFFALAYGISWSGIVCVLAATGFDLANLRPLDTGLIFVLMLHTAVNAWSLVIPVMVMPDGSNLRPFQWVVGILVVVALLLLFRGRPTPHAGSAALQARP